MNCSDHPNEWRLDILSLFINKPVQQRLLLFILLLLSVPLSCKGPVQEQLEPLPELKWEQVEVNSFVPRTQWEGKKIEWDQISKSLRVDFAAPVAIETKLLKDDRLRWKAVLDAYERYKSIEKDARLLSRLSVVAQSECKTSSALFSIYQRGQLQILLQQHRNVLWRLGRLSLAQRYVQSSLAQLELLFVSDRIKSSDELVNRALVAIGAQLKSLETPYRVPDGIWRPGELHTRMARLSNASPIILQAKTVFENWSARCQASERWGYLANSTQQIQNALNLWLEEYLKVFSAFEDYAIQAKTVERAFGEKKIAEAPCIMESLRRGRIFSELYVRFLKMQWELLTADHEAAQVSKALKAEAYHDSTPEFLLSELENFRQSIQSQKVRFSQAEDLLLVLWDESNHAFWQSLPDFIDPITHPTLAACEDEKAWQAIFSEVKQNVETLVKQTAPEPVQETSKRKKVMSPYVSQIRVFMLSPTRIDEVEKGLLAISELESQMSAMRDELMRLCKEGACAGFPESQLHRAQKLSPWVTLWKQSSVSDRAPALSFLVLKHSALYLNRLVQRMTDIYAWFAETSNADITWPKLKQWQRVWTLYAELDGSYASFLRSFAQLDRSIDAFSSKPARYNVSDNLLQLMEAQAQLFDIVMDYARFVDSSAPAPANFDDLIVCWEAIDKALEEIESKTIERDAQIQEK